ncbi:MAG: hypothetical protein M3005_03105 [Apilactobacillus sp.]|uniref:hypothetical protein n=1 Tax=Apilactobacillus TaxID=2767877 RepID=UPI0025DE7743|nr:hypothetical protein [Apilactobacillus sp.]MCT6822842.1 hypothetical protein [Apilactobacillus sp.]MCT6858541.1 hypothetical protein [Apilactobacillus sp.]
MPAKNQFVYSVNRISVLKASSNHTCNDLKLSQSKVVISPYFNDYMIIKGLIAGYTEMTEINREISEEFTLCDDL